LDIAAVRLGMLGSGEVAGVVADFLESSRLRNIVLDPVIRSSSGALLLDEAGLEVLRARLIPLCDVPTITLLIKRLEDRDHTGGP
jgi:hydroxymethylpyrimidine/phosphomethylpyrimidine kinase